MSARWDAETMRPLVEAWAQRVEEEVPRFERLMPEAEERGTVLRPPASEEQIAASESRLGVRLPPSYRSFLAIANGADAKADADLGTVGLPHGLLSIEDVVSVAEGDALGVEIWCDDPDLKQTFSPDQDAPPVVGHAKEVGYFEPYRHGLLITIEMDAYRWALVPREGQEEWEMWDFRWEGATAYVSFADYLTERLKVPSRRPDPERIDDYRRAARDPSYRVEGLYRHSAVEAVAEFDPEAGLELAIAWLEADHENTSPVRLLGLIGDRRALPPLETAATQASRWQTRSIAMDAIEALDPERGRLVWAAAADDPHTEVRKRAAWRLGHQ